MIATAHDRECFAREQTTRQIAECLGRAGSLPTGPNETPVSWSGCSRRACPPATAISASNESTAFADAFAPPDRRGIGTGCPVPCRTGTWLFGPEPGAFPTMSSPLVASLAIELDPIRSAGSQPPLDRAKRGGVPVVAPPNTRPSSVTACLQRWSLRGTRIRQWDRPEMWSPRSSRPRPAAPPPSAPPNPVIRLPSGEMPDAWLEASLPGGREADEHAVDHTRTPRSVARRRCCDRTTRPSSDTSFASSGTTRPSGATQSGNELGGRLSRLR